MLLTPVAADGGSISLRDWWPLAQMLLLLQYVVAVVVAVVASHTQRALSLFGYCLAIWCSALLLVVAAVAMNCRMLHFACRKDDDLADGHDTLLSLSLLVSHGSCDNCYGLMR